MQCAADRVTEVIKKTPQSHFHTVVYLTIQKNKHSCTLQTQFPKPIWHSGRLCAFHCETLCSNHWEETVLMGIFFVDKYWGVEMVTALVS